MEELDDKALIEQVKLGNLDAENALVLRYKPYVEKLASPFNFAGAEYDDIVQIGLLGLLKAVRSFDASFENNFKTYATTCIKNSILDGWRETVSQKNKPLTDGLSILQADGDNESEDISVIDALPSLEPTPEEQLISKEAEQAFLKMISETLGEDNLEVLMLYLSSMSYKEISEKLGITAKKVDNTIYSAKKKIEKLLGSVKK
ncbi:MAG: sigma-70 family RNA polymerase sigma factor [Clostridia bacterium]